MNIKNIFTGHPQSVGETYYQHLKVATSVGFTMLIGGLASMIHGIFPFLFQKTGSHIIIKLTQQFITRTPHVKNNIIELAKSVEKERMPNSVSN